MSVYSTTDPFGRLCLLGGIILRQPERREAVILPFTRPEKENKTS